MSVMKKILVIDDEKNFQDLILDMLIDSNYECRGAINGVEGVTEAQKYLPDLIICDIQMPIMSGEEFVKEVKASGYFKEIPIIMLSGLESSEERIKMLKLGTNDYIVKPFNPEELKLKVSIYLN